MPVGTTLLSLCLALLLAASCTHQSPVARYGKDLSYNFLIDPSYLSLAVSGAGRLYGSTPYFTILQYSYDANHHNFTPNHVLALKPQGIQIQQAQLQAATDSEGRDLLVFTALHHAQNMLRGSPIVTNVYEFSNAPNQTESLSADGSMPASSIVELCSLPVFRNHYSSNMPMVLDGKRKRLFVADMTSSKLEIFNLTLARDDSTGKVAPCPSLAADMGNIALGAFVRQLLYDDQRDLLFVSGNAYEHALVRIYNGTTAALIGVMALKEINGGAREMRLDTKHSVLYCLANTASGYDSGDAIYAYDISNLNSIRLANVYPFPKPFTVSQMEVDTDMGVLHTTSALPSHMDTPSCHWSAIASDRHAMVMNITVKDIQVKQFVLHNSELGFYGRRLTFDSACFHRFAFVYDGVSASSPSMEAVNLGVVF
jgi:hypothetical protein